MTKLCDNIQRLDMPARPKNQNLHFKENPQVITLIICLIETNLSFTPWETCSLRNHKYSIDPQICTLLCVLEITPPQTHHFVLFNWFLPVSAVEKLRGRACHSFCDWIKRSPTWPVLVSARVRNAGPCTFLSLLTPFSCCHLNIYNLLRSALASVVELYRLKC